jgi:hypothetical protein
MSCASAVGVPKMVPPCGFVIEKSVPSKSVRTRATFHFLTVGAMLGSE